MSDPTARVSAFNTYNIDSDRNEAVIKASEALVINGLVGVLKTTGKAEFNDDVASLIPVGLAVASADGIEANLTGDGTVNKVVSRGGFVLKSVVVTGASALTDFGSLVWATDGQTMTLTKPAAGLPCGFVVGWITGTTCDVYLFSQKDSLMLQAAVTGIARQGLYDRKSFGAFSCEILQGNSATTLHVETAYQRYKIISFHALPRGYDNASVAGSQALNLKINTTAVTGGVLTLGYASFDAYTDMGTPIDATAITAANQVEIGDTVKIEMAASGTGFTADLAMTFELYAVIQPN